MQKSFVKNVTTTLRHFIQLTKTNEFSKNLLNKKFFLLYSCYRPIRLLQIQYRFADRNFHFAKV